MKKIFLLLGSVVLLLGCNSTTNLDNAPQFKPLLNKVLKTKKDLVVMDLKGRKKTLALHIPGTSGIPELKDVPTQLPAQYYGAVVYGVFPVGSTFQIVHVDRTKTFESSYLDFYAVITSEGKFKGQKMDISILTNQTYPQVPPFDAEFLDEVK